MKSEDNSVLTGLPTSLSKAKGIDVSNELFDLANQIRKKNSKGDLRAKIIDYGNIDIAIGCIMLLPLCLIVAATVLLLIFVSVKAGLPGLERTLTDFNLLLPLVTVWLVFGVLPGWPGYRQLMKGRKGKAVVKQVKIYLSAIINEKNRIIDSIASDLQRGDILVVMKEIQQVIDLGFLPGFRIDYQSRIIEDTQRRDSAAKNSLNHELSKHAFNCKHCGANNIVYYSIGTSVVECDYCGSGSKI